MSLCQFTSKRGQNCQDAVLKNSEWCHRPSHYPSKRKYKEIVQELRKEWEVRTYSPDLFVRSNVPEDGWCFFHSFGRSILEMMKDDLNKIDPVRRAAHWKNSTDPILVFFRQDRLRGYFEGQMFEDVFTKELARSLHTIAMNWILDNLQNRHETTGELIIDLLLESHEMESIDEYKEQVGNLPALDDKKMLSHSNWGSVCEQYALSKHFKVNQVVFSPSRFSKAGKQFRSHVAKVVRRGLTRYMTMSRCEGEGGTSLLDGFLRMAEAGSESTALFWETLPDMLHKQTANELRRTVFHLLFILEDKDGDDMSHYNCLFLERDLLPKKMN
jgi:hypothetical protein